ncbi:Uncharacterised protein [Porphyromonas macacae]|uniref:Outer membrane protein transport protein (OMPP1/FadL/TodX) n=2 Tax=Porphyromonas macacae TaxID=28115 RepID=A0A379DH89_9PORP|nr:hypothetical protein [Porphyromonas macacae]SUB77701.1 Uncharacterised protein [Porphyromonas macacae]
MKNNRYQLCRIVSNRLCGILGVITFLMVTSSVMLAQSNSTESPYTRYGLGRLGNRTLTATRSMGGIGNGVRNGTITNPKNPASYTAVDSLTFIFDFGASISTAWYKEEGASNNRILGNFEHATILFPVTDFMAMSAGILPFAQAGYNFGNIEPLEATENGKFLRHYTGKGHINDIYLGLAIEPFKHFSIGVNTSYIFGNISHYRKAQHFTPAPFNPVFLDHLNLKGVRVNLGLQYRIGLDKENKSSIVLGATYSPNMKMRSELIRSNTMITPGGSSPFIQVDTLTSSDAYSIPQAIGVGLTYEKADKLMLGADFDYTMWKDAHFHNPQSEFVNQWQVALGGQYIPDNMQRSFWSRTAYRFGISAENSYINLPVTDTKYDGFHSLRASIGAGFPLIDLRSRLNFGIEYGLTLPKSKGMITEHTLMFTMGITFNEGWFRKLRLE